MQNKFCRICWNTSGWRIPTGDRTETGNSYVAEHGFGHEEWLFNYEWLIDGYRYGFLQPIGKYLSKYTGHHCSITLYTLTSDKNILLIGRMDNVYIPDSDELQQVSDIYTERGWLDQMRDHVTDAAQPRQDRRRYWRTPKSTASNHRKSKISPRGCTHFRSTASGNWKPHHLNQPKVSTI